MTRSSDDVAVGRNHARDERARRARSNVRARGIATRALERDARAGTRRATRQNRKGYDYFANRLRRVADDYKGKLSFNIGDKEDFSYLLEVKPSGA